MGKASCTVPVFYHTCIVMHLYLQAKRLGALNKFKSQTRSILIATDVASRWDSRCMGSCTQHHYGVLYTASLWGLVHSITSLWGLVHSITSLWGLVHSITSLWGLIHSITMGSSRLVHSITMGYCTQHLYGVLYIASLWGLVYSISMGSCTQHLYGVLYTASLWGLVYSITMGSCT